jgi:quinoprotein relay system zinc metallohydrolase 2
MKRRTALAALLGGLVLPDALARPGIAAVPFTQVAPGIHVRQGVHQDATPENDDEIANIGFIVGRDAVMVIDPGGSFMDGTQLHAAIRATTDRPIRYVVFSHVHPDHIFGAGAFVADQPTFVGHACLPAALAQRGDFYQRELAAVVGETRAGTWVMPTLLVRDTTELDLGDRKLTLTAHSAAHTDNDLSVLDSQTATLWAADLLFVDRIPSLDGSLIGWLNELVKMKALPATQAVPGHGPVLVSWPAGMADEVRYLETLARETRALIARGGDIETAVATIGLGERDRWKLFDDYNGHNVTEAFKELEWE